MMHSEVVNGHILWLTHDKVGGKTLVRVVKKNPRNIRVTTQNGEVWNAHPSFLSPAEAADVESFDMVADSERLTLGAVVQFKPGSTYASRYAKYQNLVVIGHRAGAWKLAPLGGDGGKYFNAIDAANLVVVPVTVVE